jgi:hypothetical protein
LFFLLLNLIWFFCANMASRYRNIVKRDAMPSVRAALLLGEMSVVGPRPHRVRFYQRAG